MEMCGRAEIAAVGTAQQTLRRVVFPLIFLGLARRNERGGAKGRLTATWAFFFRNETSHDSCVFFLLAQRNASSHRPRFHAVKIARRFLLSHRAAIRTALCIPNNVMPLVSKGNFSFPSWTDFSSFTGLFGSWF